MLSDVATVWQMLRGARGRDQAERLESFYGAQAAHYDRFRERLLHGRSRLIERLPITRGSLVIELGGGTGRNLLFFGERLQEAGRFEIVDLCPSLLAVARKRIAEQGWHQVTAIEADATTWRSTHGQADVVYCSYSLTMIPDWFAAVDNALALLKPGGILGVVDFHLSRRHPVQGWQQHGLFTRHFWPLWFGHDGVHPNPDLFPYLAHVCAETTIEEGRGRLPWLPFLTVPYAIFTGRKPA